jgi:hypothetical protein
MVHNRWRRQNRFTQEYAFRTGVETVIRQRLYDVILVHRKVCNSFRICGYACHKEG